MKFSKSERSCCRAFVLISLETSISPFAFLSNISAHADGRAYPLSALNRILGISKGQWEVQGASASLNRSQQRGLIIGHALLPKEGNKAEEKKKKDSKKIQVRGKKSKLRTKVTFLLRCSSDEVQSNSTERPGTTEGRQQSTLLIYLVGPHFLKHLCIYRVKPSTLSSYQDIWA